MSTDERRTSPRVLLTTNGSNPIVATIGVVPRAAILLDLSESGVGLMTTDPPPVGCIVPIWLAVPAGNPSRLLLLRVVHVTLLHGDLYRLGLTTMDHLCSNALRCLMTMLPGAP